MRTIFGFTAFQIAATSKSFDVAQAFSDNGINANIGIDGELMCFRPEKTTMDIFTPGRIVEFLSKQTRNKSLKNSQAKSQANSVMKCFQK